LPSQDSNGCIGPGSVIINEPKKGTVVAVRWLESTSTAVYSFRGSVTRQDWLQDFQLWWER
jgi:predicted lipase